MHLLTSALGKWSDLVDVRLCIGPVHLHHDKVLVGGRGWGGSFGFFWTRGWRRSWRSWDCRCWRGFQSVGGLNARERTNQVLAHQGELSQWRLFLWAIGRVFGLRVVFARRVGRGGEVQVRVRGVRWGAFAGGGFTAGAALYARGRRGLEGRWGFWGWPHLILGWKNRASDV